MCVLGLIFGILYDGIDVVVVDFMMNGGFIVYGVDFCGVVFVFMSVFYSLELWVCFIVVLLLVQMMFVEVVEFDMFIGQVFVEVVVDIVVEVGGVDVVCLYGQMVYYWVDGVYVFGMFQIGQLVWIVERVGVLVVFDICICDIIVGGYGVLFVLFFDELLFCG